MLLLGVLSPLAAQRMSGLLSPQRDSKTVQKQAARQPPGKALRRAPPLAALSPLAAEARVSVKSRLGLEPIGLHRSTRGATTGLHAAAWTQAPDGASLWRLELRSPDAAGIRVRFEGFAAGAGEVWVHDDGGQVAGPYSGRGPVGAAGAFWSDLLLGDSLIVEYSPAAGAPTTGEPPFQIASVSHLWKSPLDDSVAIGQAAPCQLDVSCDPSLEETTRAVARILFEDDGASFNCTGTLLNNRNEDFTPYFLTAAHCISDQAAAESVIAFWNFRTSICNGGAPRPTDSPRTAGAILVSTLGNFDDFRGDMTLLLLDAAPDGAFFSGWQGTAPVQFGESVFGIHHPQGSHMRLSRGRVVEDRVFRTSPEIYALVQELEGRTEPGSSGSALFNAPGVVVGALSFGPRVPRNETACSLEPYYGGYTHFSVFYPFVEQYLEGDVPPPTGPPPDPVFVPVGSLISSGARTDFVLPAVERPTLFRTDSYRLEVPPGARSLTVRAEALTSGADIDLYLRRNQPPTLTIGVIVADASAATASGIEEIRLTPADGLQPGTWYISLAAHTTDLEIQGRLLATVEGGSTASGPPRLRAVVSGATFAAGAVAPGQIVTLFGQGLGPAEGIQPGLNAQGRLPSTVSQTVVLFDEVPAPLFFVREDQINLQVPYEVAGRGSVRVLVTRAGALTPPLTIAVNEAAPGLFSAPDIGAVAIDERGALSTPLNPVRRGEIVVLYGTGEGLTNGANIAGAPALGAQLATPLLPVTVKVGDAEAEVLFAGAAPNFVGLLQLNVRIPLDAPSGPAIPVSLRVGEFDSVTATIAVE